jgi:hypothetical protein
LCGGCCGWERCGGRRVRWRGWDGRVGGRGSVPIFTCAQQTCQQEKIEDARKRRFHTVYSINDSGWNLVPIPLDSCPTQGCTMPSEGLQTSYPPGPVQRVLLLRTGVAARFQDSHLFQTGAGFILFYTGAPLFLTLPLFLKVQFIFFVVGPDHYGVCVLRGSHPSAAPMRQCVPAGHPAEK